MEKEHFQSGQIIDFKVLKRLLRFVKPYKGRFTLLLFLTISLGALAPVRPYLIQLTLDNYVAAGDYAGLVNMIIILVVLL